MSACLITAFVLGLCHGFSAASGAQVPTQKQIKKFLVDKDLKVAAMARQLAGGKLSEESARQMISQMIHGRRFYPALAKRVERKFGLRLERQDGSTPRAA